MSWRGKRGPPESDEASCKGLSIDELISASRFPSHCLPGLVPPEALAGSRAALGLRSNQSATPISSQVTMRRW